MKEGFCEGMYADGCRNKRSAVMSTLKWAAAVAVTDDVLNALQGTGMPCEFYETGREYWELGCSIASILLVAAAVLISHYKNESEAEESLNPNGNNNADKRKTKMGFSCWLLMLCASNVLAIVGASCLIADKSNDCGCNSTSVSRLEKAGNWLIGVSTLAFPGAAQFAGTGIASTMMLPGT